jgi:hypothetical protein
MSGTLAHSPADVVRALLIDLGLGTAPADADAWPIYVGQEPDSPDKVITVYDTSGVLQGRFMIDGEIQENHGFQVRVRASNHYDGYEKARAIAVALDESVSLETVSVGDDVGTGDETYTVYAISRKGGVISLGKDTPRTKLNLFTINAVASLRQIT